MTSKSNTDLAALALQKILESVFERFGKLAVTEFLVLLYIYREPNQSQQYYSRLLPEVPRSTLQRSIDILSDKGFRDSPGMSLIRIETSPTEWRERNYSLTPKGFAVVRDIQRHLDHYAATKSPK